MKDIPKTIDASNVLDLLDQCPELFEDVLAKKKSKSRTSQLKEWQNQIVDLGMWELRKSGNSGDIYLFCPYEKAMYVDEIQKDKDKIHYGTPYFVNSDGFELWMMFGGYGKRKHVSGKKKTGLHQKYRVLKESEI